MNKMNGIAPSDWEEGRNSPMFNDFGSTFCTIETEPTESVISGLSTETEYMESFDLSVSSLPPALSRDTTAVAESLSVMIQKEQTFYKCRDYLGKRSSSISSPVDDTVIITQTDRTKIVEWCYGIVDKCQLNRETVACAINMVDRFFSSNGTIGSARHYFLQDREQYQLLAVTALYMSIKIHESTVLSSDFFAEISTGTYNKEQIETTELMILRQLEYRLSAPTSIQISNHILSLLLPYVSLSPSTWDFILEEVEYQNECTVFDYYFSTQRPSTVAMASIYNTLEQGQVDEHDHQDLLRALMLVKTAHDFEHPAQLLDVKNELQSLTRMNNI